MVLRTEVMIKMFDSLERLTQLSLICMPVGNLGKVKRADQAWRLGYLLHPSQNYSDLVLNMSCPGCKNGEQRPGRVCQGALRGFAAGSSLVSGVFTQISKGQR
ncbi:uncharacterized protein AAGF69_015388 isoform 2-T2 [Amazona ochrocephala]